MQSAIFLSYYLNESTPGYGGSQGFFKKAVNQISQGASSNSQEWRLSNHIGTHIDLPRHFDDSGKNLNSFSAPEWFFKKPFLLNLPAVAGEIITSSRAFESIPLDCDMVLLKTGFQKHRSEDIYWSNNPGLSPELAKWMRKNRPAVQVMGFDFISITSYANRPLGRLAHQEFLGTSGSGHPLRVIEDMKLDELQGSPEMVIVSPLLVEGADGGPVTVLAIPFL